MRRSLFIGASMVVVLMLAFSLMGGAPGALAESASYDVVAQATVTVTPGTLPDTGAEGGSNIAVLGILGALALGIAGTVLLTTGRKSESES